MTDSIEKIDHGFLVEIAKVLIPGFKDAGGLCEGINSTLLQAVATGEKEEKDFYDRLKFLSDYFSIPGNTILKLKKDIDDSFTSKKISKGPAVKKLKQAKKGLLVLTDEEKERLEKQAFIELETARKARPALTEEKRKLQDVLAFFNTVALEHNATALGVFDTQYQLDKNKIHSVVASETLENSGKYIHSTLLGVVVANKEELTDYFAKIAASLNINQKAMDERTSFLLSADNHTVSVYFDKSSEPGKWRFFDVNILTPTHDGQFYGESELSSDVASFVFKAFSEDKNKNCGFNIRRLSKEGYDLTLKNELEIDPKTGAELPRVGKLYLSEDDDYVFLDKAGKVQKGSLPENHGLDLSFLKEKLYDFSFKTTIFEHISAQTGISIIETLDKEISKASTDLLYDKKVLKNKTSSRGYNALYFAASQGQFNLVNTLLQPGAYDAGDLSAAIVIAAQNGHIGIIEALDVANNHRIEDLNAALIRASLSGQTDTVDILLEMGAQINAVNKAGNTALMAAASNGHTQTVDLLLKDKPADRNKNLQALFLAANGGYTDTLNVLINYIKPSNVEKYIALREAAISGHVDTIQALLSAGAQITSKDKEGNTLLMLSAQQGSKSSLEALITHNLDLNALNTSGKSALEIALEANKTENVLALMVAGAQINTLSHSALNSFFILCVQEGLIDMAKKAIEVGANINATDSDGSTALILACKTNQTEMVSYLLLNPHININQTNPDGFTALMLAAYNGNTDIAKMLIAHEQINIHLGTESGHNTLKLAARSGQTKIIKELTDKKPNIEAVDQDEEAFTALMLAAAYGHTETVQALLDAGANLEAIDSAGNNALMLAAEGGHLKVVEAILYAQVIENAFKPESESKTAFEYLMLANKDGKTAIDIAREKGHKNIVKFLTAKAPQDKQNEIRKQALDMPVQTTLVFHIPSNTSSTSIEAKAIPNKPKETPAEKLSTPVSLKKP